MKRKLALVLAGVMTMGVLPMNLFAASTNSSVGWIAVQEADTVIYDRNLGSVTSFGALSGDAGNVTMGTNVKIEATDGIAVGDQITIELTNADWFFRVDTSAGSQGTPVATMLPLVKAYTNGTSNITPYNAYFTGSDTFDAGDISDLTDDDGVRTFLNGALNRRTFASGTWFTSNNRGNNGVNGAYAGVYVDDAAGYILAVSDVHRNKADIIFTKTVNPKNSIEIPIVARLLEEGKDSLATIIPGANSKITSSTVPLGTVSSGTTETTVKTTVVGRNTISVEPITIRENKLGTLNKNGNGQFKLVAPDGWVFADPKAGKDPVTVGFYAFEGNEKLDATNPIVLQDNNTEMLFTVDTLKPAKIGGSKGEIYIKNVRLVRDGADYGTEVKLTIKDVADSAPKNGIGISEKEFLVAKAQDYGVILSQTTASDKIPQLITGRYPSDAGLGAANKVVNFTLTEATLNSWWTERDTTLVFPEGVKVIGFKADPTNFDKTSGNIYKVGTPGVKYKPTGTAADAYEIDGNKLTIVGAPQPKENEISTIEFQVWVSVGQSFNQTAEPKDITVSVEGGGLKPEELPPALKVATAIAPITITTEVNEIKIGLQAQPTSNITIKENFAGALKDVLDNGNDVNLSVSDVYGKLDNNDLLFTNTAKIERTAGNIKIDDEVVGGSLNDYNEIMLKATSKIAFDVEKESTEASTIVISNVSIKVSRVIPETDKDTYKVFAYGPAIAYNFNANDKSKGRFGTLADAGVYADYVKIGSAGDAASASSEFKFSIAEGTETYNVNGKEYPLPEDMKGYNKNGTVMVPIRLISEGFGLGVHWNDSSKTVVVDLSQVAKAEFPVGKTYMKVAGAQIDMTDANGKAVATENIKGRTFLPIRQLAYALGINDANIVWDNDTQTVTFNPSK